MVVVATSTGDAVASHILDVVDDVANAIFIFIRFVDQL